MARPQRAKTPQQPKGQKQQGQKMPQSAPAGRKFQGKNKMAGLEETPRKAQGTPKPGDKRKLDTMLASQKGGKGTPKTVNSKPNTPAAMAKKANSSPAKLPQTPQIFKPQTPRDKKTPHAKKTPQTKTPASAGKGGKKTPQPVEKDSEDDDEDEDDDDDEQDMGGLEMGSDDDSEGEDMEEDDEDEDDDEDEEESKASSPKKRVATIGRATGNDEEDDEDDDSDMEDDDEEDEDDDGDIDENDILQKIKELREASNKQEKKQPVANKQKQQNNSKAQKQPQSPTKQKQDPQSPTKQSATKAKPLTEKQGQEQPPSPTKQKAKEEPAQLPKTAAAASNSGDRDKRTLFVKNLPPTVSPSDIRALSKDIKEVRFRITVRAKRREKKKMGYAFIEFASEAVAEKNYKALQGAKIGSCEVAVDYVGEKSSHQAGKPKAKQEVGNPDPLRLYVTGFGSDLKEADLYKLFPKAQDITVPRRKKDKSPVGYAFIAFATEQQCKAAHDKSQNAKIQGHSLVVLYAKKLSSDAQKKDPKLNQKMANSEKTAQPPAKKAKLEDSDDDDEDDDDDDDEEDDNDEDDDEDDSDEDDEDDEDEDDIAGEDEDGDDDDDEDDDEEDDEEDDDDDDDDDDE